MARIDGIRSIEDIRQRCVVDEVTGCWLWSGTRANGGSPSMWYPVAGKSVAGGVVLFHLENGTFPPRGRVYHRTCESGECMNPEHRHLGTRSTQMKAAKVERPLTVRAAIARARRVGSRLSEEDIVAIRESTDSLAVIGERYGIHLSYAGRIRRGVRRVALTQGASIFNFGGGAMTNASSTSVAAYHDIRKDGTLTRQQKLIVEAMAPDRDYSLQELCQLTGLPINTVSGRANDLRHLGVLELGPVRPCGVTGRAIHPSRLASGDQPQGALFS